MKASANMELTEARRLAARGSYAAAYERARAAIATDPSHAAALDLLARLLTHLGKADEAVPAAARAAALEPSNADYHYSLGRAHNALGNNALAITHYERVLRINPAHVRALVSLGVALSALGRHEEAMTCHKRALVLDPHNPEARLNLAQEMDRLGRMPASDGEGSIAAVKAGIAAELVRLRESADRSVADGRPMEALERVADARRLAPDDAGLHVYAAEVQASMGKIDDALASFGEAARLQPLWLPPIQGARLLAMATGLADLARHYTDRAAALAAADALAIAAELVLPAIQDSMDDIVTTRARLAAALDRLLARRLSVDRPEECFPAPGFFLAYHGQSNRELKEKLAQLFLHTCPQLQWKAAHLDAPKSPRERLRIGFASRFLRGHSIGKTSRGLMAQLSRERFEVIAIRLPPLVEDDTSRWISAHSDRHLTLDANLQTARQQIGELGLDVLFYQDIGMEPMSYFLAFARLAPVQCVSFGHPDTTGIPNMDYFVSNDAYELPGAQSNYSEHLFLLHDLPTLAYYYRPQIERPPAARQSFGFGADEHLYVCPQVLFKLHPEFDALLASILRRDPQGKLILICGLVGQWTTQLERRFALSMPDVADRVRFLPQLPHGRFLTLLATADVILDTPHFNGMNSSLEAFAAGTPVVTLPGELQRARHTAAMYRAMGMLDCVPVSQEEYVQLAVRLGFDPRYREAFAARIAANSPVLFENHRVVSEFERFFTEAVRQRRHSGD